MPQNLRPNSVLLKRFLDINKIGLKLANMIKVGLGPAAGTDMMGIYLGNIDSYKVMYVRVTRQSGQQRLLGKVSLRTPLRLVNMTISRCSRITPFSSERRILKRFRSIKPLSAAEFSDLN